MPRKSRRLQPKTDTNNIAENPSEDTSDEDIPLNKISKRKRGRPPKEKSSKQTLKNKSSIPESMPDSYMANAEGLSQSIAGTSQPITEVSDLTTEKSVTNASREICEGAERKNVEATGDHAIQEKNVIDSTYNLDQDPPEEIFCEKLCKHPVQSSEKIHDPSNLDLMQGSDSVNTDGEPPNSEVKPKTEVSDLNLQTNNICNVLTHPIVSMIEENKPSSDINIDKLAVNVESDGIRSKVNHSTKNFDKDNNMNVDTDLKVVETPEGDSENEKSAVQYVDAKNVKNTEENHDIVKHNLEMPSCALKIQGANQHSFTEKTIENKNMEKCVVEMAKICEEIKCVNNGNKFEHDHTQLENHEASASNEHVNKLRMDAVECNEMITPMLVKHESCPETGKKSEISEKNYSFGSQDSILDSKCVNDVHEKKDNKTNEKTTSNMEELMCAKLKSEERKQVETLSTHIKGDKSDGTQDNKAKDSTRNNTNEEISNNFKNDKQEQIGNFPVNASYFSDILDKPQININSTVEEIIRTAENDDTEMTNIRSGKSITSRTDCKNEEQSDEKATNFGNNYMENQDNQTTDISIIEEQVDESNTDNSIKKIGHLSSKNSTMETIEQIPIQEEKNAASKSTQYRDESTPEFIENIGVEITSADSSKSEFQPTNTLENDNSTCKSSSNVCNIILDKSTSLEIGKPISQKSAEQDGSITVSKTMNDNVISDYNTDSKLHNECNKSPLVSTIEKNSTGTLDLKAKSSEINTNADNSSKDGATRETTTDVNNVLNNCQLSDESLGDEEKPKWLSGRKYKKWLALQKKLQSKYGVEPRGVEVNPLTDEKFENVSAVKIIPDKTREQNENKKQPNEEKNTVLKKNDAPPIKFSEVSSSAATGVGKFLQLMNILNKNPDKCRKWLQNQDLQRKNLGEQYKEPIIYSTVKLISLGQEKPLKSSDDKSLPKVTNSLDLLNVLYANPDKCKMWLKRQEELKKKHGKKYQEPAIYSTVKLIAIHHSRSTIPKNELKINKNESKVLSKDKTDEQRSSVLHGKNETKTLKSSSDCTTDETPQTSNTHLSKSKKLASIHDNISAKSTNELDTPPHTDVSRGEKSPKPSCKSSKESEQDASDTNTKNVAELEDPLYVLIPPNTKHNNVKKIIHRQKYIRNLLGKQYRVPTYNRLGNKESYNTKKKLILLVPLNENKVRQLNISYSLYQPKVLDWIENEIKIMLTLGDTYKEPILINEKVDTPPYLGEHFVGVSHPHVQQSLTEYYPPPADFTVTPQCTANYYDSNFSPSMYNPPPPGTDVLISPLPHINNPSIYASSTPFNLPNSPSAFTSYTPINIPNAPSAYASSTPFNLLNQKVTQNPKQGTEYKPTICKLPQIYKTAGVEKIVQSNTANQQKATIEQLNEESSNDLKGQSIIEEYFCTDNCEDNVAFKFKGKEIFYPFFIKDFFSRKKWVDNQHYIYKKKGNLYTPPEFTKDGKLAAHSIEQLKNSKLHTSITKTKDTATPIAAQEAYKAYLDSINSDVIMDKFGMRVNQNALKQIQQSSKCKASNEKAKVTVKDVFSAIPKIQPPPDKAKIAVVLKKDVKKNKKEKNPDLKKKDIECKSIRVAYQNAASEAKLSEDLYTKPVQYPGFPEAKPLEDLYMKPVQYPGFPAASNVPKPTTGWPVSMIKPSVSTPTERKRKSDSPTRSLTPPLPSVVPKTHSESKPSASERLGSPTEAKKPKLTVNLIADNKTKEVTKKVVKEHVPVHLRKDVLESKDLIVKQYLEMWPWSKPIKILRECSSKSLDPLLDEIEMTPCYASKSSWIKVVATKYPPHFKMEDLLDFLLSVLGDKEFIPCFIEFTSKSCSFLVSRSEQALMYFHSNGLVAKKDGICVSLQVAQTNLSLDNLHFYKGRVFKTKLLSCYDEEFKSLNLSAFQLQPDNMHFMYFPLNIPRNQIFIMNVVKAILPWKHITTLDLSANRLTNLTSVNLSNCFPSLRILDLSNNLLPTVSSLVCFKGIPMYSLALDGNPLCRNFIQQEHYINVVKLIFPCLLVLDGIKVDNSQEVKKNFTVSSEAVELVNSFLEIFFTLTDCNDRAQMESLYTDKSVFSITCRPEMKRNVMYQNLREFYMWCRSLNDCINPKDPFEGTITGGAKIVRYFTKWPVTMHDPYSFTVDIVLHTETTTIFKVTGLFKIPAESLNQEEPVTEFSRTFVLVTEDGVEYKIINDMMYISEATPERISSAFKHVSMSKPLSLIDASSLRFDTPPDDDTKARLEDIVANLTGLKRNESRRCLDSMDWNLKKSLEYFMKLDKIDALNILQS